MERLTGKVFGELTVLSDYRSTKGYRMCHCLCTCGKNSEVIFSNLKSGRTKSCGHFEKQNQKKYKNLIGKKFGDLTVQKKTEKRKEGTIVWECRCDCGRLIEVSRRQLIRGYIKSCGYHRDDQLRGKQFSELTVLEVGLDKKKLYCRCSCGKEVWLLKYNILSGHTKSCGHLLKKDNFERIDGVVLATLRKRISSRNTSGYTGVSQTRTGDWVAYITFRKKRYNLGTFKNIEDAVLARRRAEEYFYSPIFEKEKKIHGGD